MSTPSDKKFRRIAGRMALELEEALEDLGLCERDDDYEINMGTWHDPDVREDGDDGTEDICYVCLAGAWLAKSKYADRNAMLRPNDMGGKTKRIMSALDELRKGNLTGAFGCRMKNTNWGLADATAWLGKSGIGPYMDSIPKYEEDPAMFKTIMRDIARLLRMLSTRPIGETK